LLLSILLEITIQRLRSHYLAIAFLACLECIVAYVADQLELATMKSDFAKADSPTVAVASRHHLKLILLIMVACFVSMGCHGI